MALQDHPILVERGVDSVCESWVEPELCNRSVWASSQKGHKPKQQPRQHHIDWSEERATDVEEELSNPREARNGFMAEAAPPFFHHGLRPPMSAGDDGNELPDSSSSLLTGNFSFDDSAAVVSRPPNSKSTTRPSQRGSADEQSHLQLPPTTGTSSVRVLKRSHEAERESRTTKLATEPREPRRPDALSFLEMDPPPLTEESILHAIAKASENWSPRSISSFESIESSQPSTTGTDTTTPEQSVDGDSPPTTAVPRPTQLYQDSSAVIGFPQRKRESHARQPKLHPHLDQGQDRYGTPEMARGPVKHPHFPPNELQPRLAAPGQGYSKHLPKHLPRAEKLPMTGYELVAAKLSSSDSWATRRCSNGSSQRAEDTAIRPIYRKFEALNHRLLLHLQDELSELEEQLHRLDTADTQTRRLQNCILPASRRAESMAGGELQWRKTDILGKIGFKLGQYSKHFLFLRRIHENRRLTIPDHALDSLNKTMSLPPASRSDVEDYRTYLATHNPIAEIETRFLDPAEDLVCLEQNLTRSSDYSPSHSSATGSSDGLLTPVPHKVTFSPPTRPSSYGRTHSRSTSSSSLPPPGSQRPHGRELFPSPSQDFEVPPKNTEEAQVDDNTTTTTPTQTRPTTPEEPHDNRINTQPLPLRVKQAAILASLALILPVLIFPVVTDFAGRMAIVLVAALVVSALRRNLAGAGLGELWRDATCRRGGYGGGHEWVVAGVYGAVMAVVAGMF